MKKLRELRNWWKNRHWRRMRGLILKLNAPQQLGFAQSIISSIAVQYSRKHRKEFLQIQFCRIEEKAKDLIADNKRPA